MAKKGNTKYHVKPDKQLLNNILTAVAYIAIGVLFCVFKGAVLNWLVWIIGALLIIRGAVDFLSGRRLTSRALAEIVLGVLTILFGVLFAEAIAIVIGIVIILYGVVNLLNNSRNIFTLLVSVLTIVCGVMIVANSSGAISWLFVAIGVMFIVDGVLALFGKKLK